VSGSLAPIRPELVWFTGPDALRFLNDLISQEIGTLGPGNVSRSLLLTPQGKVDFILWVLRGEEMVGLITEDGRGDELVARLSRYLIRVKVAIAKSHDPLWLVVGEGGPAPRRWSGSGDDLRADVSWPELARHLSGTRPDLPLLTEEEYTALRIGAGEPLVGVDVSDSTIPQETGLVASSISFDKGCFLGQELVARLDSRAGRVNHHLRILRFKEKAPAMGSAVARSGGGVVGTVTSAAGEVGLALLRRGVEPGDVVSVGDVEAVVEAVPGE
jgi:folate-binding protein YgfZ